MILFCGYANLDVLVGVPCLPGNASRLHARSIERMDGGTAANAAVAAARDGARSAFGGAVGDGAEDSAFLGRLADDGVDISWVSTDRFISTAVVLVTPDGERVVISQDDALDDERIARGIRNLRHRGGGWLYLDGYRWPGAVEILRVEDPRHTLKIFTDLDGCESPDAARSALKVSDHLVLGRPQLLSLFPSGQQDAGMLAQEYGAVVIVTDGPRGWELATPEGTHVRADALLVTAVDSTGAGDCFCGVYLASLDAGMTPEQSAHRAAVAAALSCTRPGARAAPSREEINRAVSPAQPI